MSRLVSYLYLKTLSTMRALNTNRRGQRLKSDKPEGVSARDDRECLINIRLNSQTTATVTAQRMIHAGIRGLSVLQALTQMGIGVQVLTGL
jgi:hypothetical protein